jgi:hypothetical protein
MPDRKKKRKRQQRDTIVVQDYSSPGWAGVVETLVAQFTAIMPGNAPRLVYSRKPPMDCGGLPSPGKTPRIAICSSQVSNESAVATSTIGDKHSLITLYDQHFGSDARYRREIMCHEMMHSLADVGDAYGTNADSCVFGHLDHPGGADAQLLAERFRRRK